jgi:hypothetical protein
VSVVIRGVTIQKLTSKNNQRAKTVLSKYERGNLDQNDKIILLNKEAESTGLQIATQQHR